MRIETEKREKERIEREKIEREREEEKRKIAAREKAEKEKIEKEIREREINEKNRIERENAEKIKRDEEKNKKEENEELTIEEKKSDNKDEIKTIKYNADVGFRMLSISDYKLTTMGFGGTAGVKMGKISIRGSYETGSGNKTLKTGDTKYTATGYGIEGMYSLMNIDVDNFRIEGMAGAGYEGLALKDKYGNQVDLSGIYGKAELKGYIEKLIVGADLKIGFGEKTWTGIGISLGREF